MAVSKEITRLEKSNVRLSLTVPKEDVQSQYQDLLREYTQKVQMPGFRKGKVPLEVLERKFGKELQGEALGKIIDKAVGDVFDDENMPKDEKPLPYARPELQGEPELNFGQDLSFSIVYDVLPNISVGQWKGLEAEVPDAAVSEDDIGRELEELRERNAFVLDRDESAEAKSGDVATVTYCELDENGEEAPDTERKDFVFTLGSGQNAYVFDDDIAGMKKGETIEFAKTYPEDDTKTTFAGQTKKLRVTLTELKEKMLPELDDELAQDIDEKYRTLGDLKNSIRERLEKNLKRRIRELTINGLLEKIMENTPVILPESMVRVEIDGRIRSMARQFGMDSEKLIQMMTQMGDNANDMVEKLRPAAEKALHSRLIVETIMEEQHIVCDDLELDNEIQAIADEEGESFDEIEKRYQDGNMIEYLQDEVRERKFFDVLLAENTVKQGPKTNYLDVVANNG